MDDLNRAGIAEYTVGKHNECTTVTVERGYCGFVTVFTFNPDLSLKDLGAYE